MEEKKLAGAMDAFRNMVMNMDLSRTIEKARLDNLRSPGLNENLLRSKGNTKAALAALAGVLLTLAIVRPPRRPTLRLEE